MTQDILPPPAVQQTDTTDRVLSAINYVLLFISPFTFHLGGLIALVIAYVRKGAAPALEATHFAFQIRVFWWSFLLMVAAIILVFVVVGAGIGAGVSSAIADIWAIHWGIGAGIAALGMVGFGLASFLWVFLGSLIGFFKLMSNQPA